MTIHRAPREPRSTYFARDPAPGTSIDAHGTVGLPIVVEVLEAVIDWHRGGLLRPCLVGDVGFTDRLADMSAEAWAQPVTFDNPLQEHPVTPTVHLARTAGGSSPRS